MPKTKPKLVAKELTAAAHQLTANIGMIVRRAISSAHSAKEINKALKEIDNIITSGYRNIQERNRIMGEFDFGRAILASRLGIDPSQVTDDFIKKLLAQAHREADAHFAAREKALGVKIAPDTPQARQRILAEAERIIASTPK